MSAPGRDGPRPALPAARLAEMRRERAERLDRLRGTAGPAPDAAPALATFLSALRAALEGPAVEEAISPAAATPVLPAAAVLPFQRVADRGGARVEPEAPPAPSDLDRLPGAGPGLVWALEQAGVARLADLAGAAPEPLADQLGPIGGLIDLPGWIAFARAATETAPPKPV